MAKKQYPHKQATGYETGMLTPKQIREMQSPPIPTPEESKTCVSCGCFRDEEESDQGPCGECRLNPPAYTGEHLTRRGLIRRYPVVLSNTPACSYHRPRAA